MCLVGYIGRRVVTDNTGSWRSLLIASDGTRVLVEARVEVQELLHGARGDSGLLFDLSSCCVRVAQRAQDLGWLLILGEDAVGG